MGSRRSAAAIEAAAARAADADAPRPRPRRPLLGEAEKARCALLMEHRGAPPPPGEHEGAHGVASRPGRGGRLARRHEDDEDDGEERPPSAAAAARAARRFAELEGEVAERERFLASMRAAGALRREHVEAVRAQVADRVAEMRRLHARLESLGAGGRGATAATASAAPAAP